MSMDVLDVLLAALPPLLVLVLMVGFRRGGGQAGLAGWLAALVLALLRFGAGGDVLLSAHVRALVLTLDVVYIVWAALLLYMVVEEAGALRVIAGWFTRLTGDGLLRVLLLSWVFAAFLQGVGGFGVPVAIVAPLLVGLGLAPLTAVVLPSIGHAWAVTFGSLGSSFIALIGVTGADSNAIAGPTALLLGLSVFSCGLLAAHVYDGIRGVWHSLPAVGLIGLAMAVVQYLLATNNLWNIGSAGAALAGLVVGLWVARWPLYRSVSAAAVGGGGPVDARPVPSFPLAISGYLTLVVLAVLITGVEPIRQGLGQVRLSVSLPEVETARGWVTAAAPDLGLSVLSHTGAVLLYSAALAYALYKHRGYYSTGAEKRILHGVWQKGYKAALGILAMVAMATVMSTSGMTRALAEWLAHAVPPVLYAFVSTLIGALGAFMTGSNTNSNAVFGVLQMDTALLMSLSVPIVLATQTAAASIGSLLAPAKIIVGASTAGMAGDEGSVLRALLLYGGALLLLIAVVAFVLLQFA